jgi:hypothetical protein
MSMSCRVLRGWRNTKPQNDILKSRLRSFLVMPLKLTTQTTRITVQQVWIIEARLDTREILFVKSAF